MVKPSPRCLMEPSLAKSDDTAVQALPSLRTYGFQFHPECSRDRIMSWCGSEAQFMDKAFGTADAIERQLNKRTADTPTTKQLRSAS